MARQQRKCANCRFYSDSGLAGNGWCTHPKRQLTSGVKILVRAGELACRNSWGGDLFQPRRDDADTANADADLPADDRDDEVTSVTVPAHRPVDEDRLVSDRPASHRDLHDPNDAAQRDQEERARIMARGSRDAVMQARQRFTMRHHGPQDVVEEDNMTEPDRPDASADRVITHQTRFSDRGAEASDPNRRSPAEPVPREEVSRRWYSATPRDRFETIPEVDPNFDLPGKRHADPGWSPRITAASDADALAGTPDDTAQITTYEHVLQRARRIRRSKQDAMRPLRHADLRIDRDTYQDDESFYPPDDAHRHADAPGSQQAAPVETEIAPPESQHFAVMDEPHVEFASDSSTDLAWDDTSIDEDAAEPDLDGYVSTAELNVDEDEYVADWDNDWVDVYDDAPLEPEAPRRRWFERLGFGRRDTSFPHDDADVTRHASAQGSLDALSDAESDEIWPSEWDDEYHYDDDDGSDLPWITAADTFTEPGPVPARDVERSIDPPSVLASRTKDPVTVRAEARPLDQDAPHEPWQRSRPRRTGWHRHHQDIVLPDLDDHLFEASSEPREVMAIGATRDHQAQAKIDRSTTDASRRAAEILESRSPRDSFFRSSRFETEAEEPTTIDRHRAASRTQAPSLPDLDTGGLDVREVADRGGELLDMTIDIAPDIPRECRTCRSFRGAEGGARGWCTNEWAFTHRRMVNEDDLACESSIGCWWVPADRYRQTAIDDTYASPTPRMDALIARMNEPDERRQPDERRVSGG